MVEHSEDAGRETAGEDPAAAAAGAAAPGRRAEDQDQLLAVLQAQRSRMEEIFRRAPTMIAVTRGPEHCVELANPRFCEVLRLGEVVGRAARDVLPQPDAAELIELMDSVHATGETQRIDEQRLRLAGPVVEDVWISFIVQPLRHAAGAVQGLLIHGVDVTAVVRARQEAQEQAAELEMQAEELQSQASELEQLHEEARAIANRLSRSESLLAEAQRMAGVGSWEWEIRTGEIVWSEELFRLFGEVPGEVQVSLEAYMERIHPEDRAPVRQVVENALATGQPFAFDHRVVWPDGTVRDFQCRGRVWTDPAGAPCRMSGSAQDVTEQRAAEEARRDDARVVSTLHQFGQNIARDLDGETIVQEATDAATALTGAQFGAFFYNVLDDAGEAYTLYTISGVPREDFSKFPMPRNTPLFHPTFHGEGVVRSDDITQDPRYGEVAPHYGMPEGHLPVRSYLAVPVMSRSGEVLGGLFFGHAEPGRFQERHERLAVGIAGWAAVALDNAHLFNAERRARSEAERANNAKSDFLATMSHELRTPLNAMIGYSDLMLAGIPEPIPDSARQKVERIGLSARHLLQLIEEILTFSRLEAGEEVLRPVDGDAVRVASEVQVLLEPLALARQLQFTCQLPGGPVPIHTDVRKLSQVLLNVVGNAIKFTDEGAVGIRLEEDGDDVVFHIEDTGPGIAPEHAEQIFEPFWQVEQGATRSKEGTGLGLAVARRLARMLGGDVVLHGTPGFGSRFVVRIPRRA
jgi:signal transduction histidine kinase/PAS domain-containing protein